MWRYLRSTYIVIEVLLRLVCKRDGSTLWLEQEAVRVLLKELWKTTLSGLSSEKKRGWKPEVHSGLSLLHPAERAAWGAMSPLYLHCMHHGIPTFGRRG